MANREKEAEWILQADFCRKMADQSSSPEKKIAWLNPASKWLALASNVRPIPEAETPDPFSEIAVQIKGPVASR